MKKYLIQAVILFALLFVGVVAASVTFLATLPTPPPVPADVPLITSETHSCNTADLYVNGKLFCFRGNVELSNIPALVLASVKTGIQIKFLEDTNGDWNFVSIFVEDVGDLENFWDATGLFK